MTKLTKLIVIGTSSLLLSACGGSSSGGTAGDGASRGTDAESIQLAKDTFQELRTQALTVVDYDDSGTAGYLDEEALDIGTALESCSIDAGTSAEYIAYITEQSMTAMDSMSHNYSEVDGDLSLDITCTVATNICTYDLSNNGLAYSGTVTLPDLEDFDPDNFTTLNAAFNGTVPYDADSDAASNLQTFDLDLTLTKTADGADIDLTNISLEQGTASAGISNLSISTGYSVSDADGLEISYIKLNSVTLNGTCSDYTAIGTLTLSDYVENESLLDADTGSWVPSQLLFEGSFTNTATDGSIAGSIDVDLVNAATMTHEDEPVLNVNINGTLAMPTRPEMDLELTYSSEDNNHDFTSTYSYGSTEINLVGILDIEGENGEITITDNNGIQVLIIIENGDLVEGDSEDETGSIVTHNGLLIGTIEYRDELPVIAYTDGTFESLP
jgi:hypothetical protein